MGLWYFALLFIAIGAVLGLLMAMLIVIFISIKDRSKTPVPLTLYRIMGTLCVSAALCCVGNLIIYRQLTQIYRRPSQLTDGAFTIWIELGLVVLLALFAWWNFHKARALAPSNTPKDISA